MYQKLCILLFTLFSIHACTVEPNPSIEELRVCGTPFADCEEHQGVIPAESSNVTAAVIADDMESSYTFQFTIYVEIDGEYIAIGDSDVVTYSDALNGDEPRSNDQLVGWTWAISPSSPQTPGNYRMEVVIQADTELRETIDYVLE